MRLLSILLWLLSVCPLMAADPLPPLSEPDARAWHAVGRVAKAEWFARGACTGTLIAPDVVLTAAHCTPTAVPDDPDARHVFTAGAFESTHADEAKVIAAMRHPVYRRPGGRHDPRYDLGLLFLDRPLSGIAPLDMAPLPLPGLDVAQTALIGYHRRHPFRPSGSTTCPLLSQTLQLIFIGCRVISGNSGSPVMIQTEDASWQIIGVASAQSGENAIVAVLDDWVIETLSQHLATSN